jgi:SHS2 domain-containing protein
MEESDDLRAAGAGDPRAEVPVAWVDKDMSGVYAELAHPADLFLEIRGRDVDELFANALYAFYSQVADLREVGGRDVMEFDVRGGSLDETLRALLAEALYRFDTLGFVAAWARVTVRTEREPAGGTDAVRVTARLWGGRPERQPGSLLTEVKAVTYHRLAVAQTPGGDWRATVLFDV